MKLKHTAVLASIAVLCVVAWLRWRLSLGAAEIISDISNHWPPVSLSQLKRLQASDRDDGVQPSRALVTLLTAIEYLPSAGVLGVSIDRVHPINAQGHRGSLGQPPWASVVMLSDELFNDPVVIGNLTACGGWDYALSVPVLSNPAHEEWARRVNRTHAGMSGGDLRMAAARVDAELGIKELRLQPHKSEVLTKLRVFELGALFDRVLFFDADTLLLKGVADPWLEGSSADVAVKLGIKERARDDESLLALAPSLKHMDPGCTKQYPFMRFQFKDRDYCHSFVEGYRGVDILPTFNAGVMLVEPDARLLEQSLAELTEERRYENSCLGSAGCNDQRLINFVLRQRRLQTTDDAAREQSAQHVLSGGALPLDMNVDCDQWASADYIDRAFVPTVLHYRGHEKIWSLVPGRRSRRPDWAKTALAHHCNWKRRDRCSDIGGFIALYPEYLRRTQGADAATAFQLELRACKEKHRV